MNGFKKGSISPLNPGAITDQQLAPSKAVILQVEELVYSEQRRSHPNRVFHPNRAFVALRILMMLQQNLVMFAALKLLYRVVP